MMGKDERAYKEQTEGSSTQDTLLKLYGCAW